MCNGKENIETFYEKELQKINQKNLKLKKIKRKVSDKLYVKWKGDDNQFSGTDKKSYYLKMSYYPELGYSSNKIKFELDFYIIMQQNLI